MKALNCFFFNRQNLWPKSCKNTRIYWGPFSAFSKATIIWNQSLFWFFSGCLFQYLVGQIWSDSIPMISWCKSKPEISKSPEMLIHPNLRYSKSLAVAKVAAGQLSNSYPNHDHTPPICFQTCELSAIVLLCSANKRCLGICLKTAFQT